MGPAQAASARLLVVIIATFALLVGCARSGGTGGMTGGSGSGPDEAGATPVRIGLVTKTDTNPYFIRIREAAIATANQWRGAEVIARAGKFDGDNQGQVDAVEELMQAGVRGILITPNNSTGIVDVLRQARARGIVVIALDTETSPIDAVDATFETDNVRAGEGEGSYLKASLGNTPPKIVMLNGSPGSTVDVQRQEGFLKGFGLPPGAPQIVASAVTGADATRAQQAMTALLDQHPDVNAVYTINEPVAEGAYRALVAKGMTEKVKIATIDGSCPGVLSVRANRYVATVMQFPTAMAQEGVNAVMAFATRGVRPPGGVQNTGAEVVANEPGDAVPVHDTGWGLQKCWG